ncbi:MAG: aminopeptidase P family protein, partial [Oscillospiraceae bacterium]|nr:aminopeptidase P family protein [Oscillospiraceae bacterium]
MEFSREVLAAELERRTAIFHKVMERNGLDGLFFTSTAQQAYQMGCKYLSGYALSSRRDIGYVTPGSLPYLVVPTIGQQSSAQKVSWLPPDHILSDELPAATEKFMRSLPSPCPRVGLYEPNEIPASILNALNSVKAEFTDITAELTEERQCKSEYELECIKAASKIAVKSVEWVVKNIAPGKSEREIVGLAEGFVRANGGEDSLILIRAQKPHTFISRASDRPIAEDGVFVYSVEMAGPGGYWTQCVRPIFMKRGAQPEAFRILGIIREAEAAGAAQFVPGNRVCDVAAAIEEVVFKNGLKMGVWSGHGMGADLGDCVDIGTSTKMKIVPNMILTLHPSVMSDEDGLLYGNTWMSTEGAPVCL